jgi:hypothetical protein
MGFLRSLFSDKALAAGVIKANESTYWKLRKQRPGREEHFYLATTLFRRFLTRLQLTGGDPAKCTKARIEQTRQEGGRKTDAEYPRVE